MSGCARVDGFSPDNGESTPKDIEGVNWDFLISRYPSARLKRICQNRPSLLWMACSVPKPVNSRPCERNQTKLKSLCCLSFIRRAIGFSWARQEMRECFGSGSVGFAGLQSTGWFGARSAFPIRSDVIRCRTQRGRTQVVRKRTSARISPLLSRAEVAQW